MSSWGMYKPGQGYWVRVMTAAAIALITFATAFWLMGQLAVLADKLPKTTWSGAANLPTGASLNAGDRVTLLSSPRDDGKPVTIGAATVQTFDSATSTFKIGSFEPAGEDSAVVDAASITPAAGASFSAPIRGSFRGEPRVSPTILQGVGAAVVLVFGAAVAWWFCGAKPRSCEFLIATDMEMKKVAWSTRKDILTSTWVVVGASFLIAAVLFGIDVTFQWFFRGIGVLQ